MNRSDPVVTSETFDYIMGVWIPTITCCLGIIGNALSLATLSLERVKRANTYSLMALACADLVLLCFALVQQAVPMMCLRSKSTSDFCRYQGYSRVYSWPIICMAQTASIYLTLLISGERYLAIKNPFNLCQLPKVCRYIILILVFSVVFNSPKFFEFETVRTVKYNTTFVEMNQTMLRENNIYRYAYNTGLYGLIMYAIPLVSLSILNVQIVLALSKAKREWSTLNRHQQKEMKATKVPLCIVIVFILCGTHNFLSFTFDAIYINYRKYKWLQIYTAVGNALVVLNSAINFLIFYTCGAKFRKQFKQLITCSGKDIRNDLVSKEKTILLNSFKSLNRNTDTVCL